VKTTRRAFVAMIGAAAALLGIKAKPSVAKPADEPTKPDDKPVIWIGHF
jgi:hypothetical protein